MSKSLLKIMDIKKWKIEKFELKTLENYFFKNGSDIYSIINSIIAKTNNIIICDNISKLYYNLIELFINNNNKLNKILI